jgi:hypothetical protein
MRFFDSRIESKLYSDNTFITSEQQSYQHPRLYTIRIALNNGIDIENVGEFQQFRSFYQVREYRKTIQYKNDLINILNKYISNLIHKNKANRINAKRYLAIKDTLKGMEYAGISKDLNN